VCTLLTCLALAAQLAAALAAASAAEGRPALGRLSGGSSRSVSPGSSGRDMAGVSPARARGGTPGRRCAPAGRVGLGGTLRPAAARAGARSSLAGRLAADQPKLPDHMYIKHK
jgi:hypothetical protein